MSRATDETPAEMVELHFEKREGHLKVTAPDNHIMIVPMEAAAEACRALRKEMLFRDQFDLLINRLAEWLQERDSLLKAGYLTVCDTGLMFVVVQEAQAYDRGLEDDLTALDLEIANDSAYDLIRLDVLALPNVSEGSVKSFLSAKHTFRFHMNG